MERGKSQPRRCAIYTRKSSEEGLEQDFNSLHAQREACEAFIKSQHGEGWRLVRAAYDDGGFSGGTMERPALQRLLADIRERVIDVIVVYKVDRLTRSLADFFLQTIALWAACYINERRHPIQRREDLVLDRARLDVTGPADDQRCAHAAFPGSELAAFEGRGAAVGVGDHFRAVVGGQYHNGVIKLAHVLQFLEHVAD